jgi:DNA-binding NarL/FixJ family response regulator
MLSSSGEETAVVEAMVGGAAGYLLKDRPLPDVVQAIRQVAAGRTIMDPELMGRVMARLRGDVRDPSIEALSLQERRVLNLISEGMTNKEIAGELYLAEQTVKNYVSNVLAKLGLKGRIQAANLFRTQGRGKNPHFSG